MAESLHGTIAGFRACADVADRRRTRSLGTVAVACVAALTLAGTVDGVHSRAGTSRLDVATTPDGGHRPGQVPAVRPTATPGTFGLAGPPVPGRAVSAAVPVAPASPGAEPVAGRDAARPHTPQSTPIVLTKESAPIQQTCLAMGPCVGMDTPQRGSGGWTLVTRLCAPTSGDASVTFTTDPEVAYTVTWSHGGRVWWSDGDRDPASVTHVETVDRGTCWVWTTRWSERRHDGKRLPAGRYSVGVEVRVAGQPLRRSSYLTIP